MPGVTGVLQYFGRAGALEDERDMRQQITSATTYYVRTTGNDLNNGLSPATAWRTVQHGVDWIGTNLDFNSQTVTLDIGAGSFAGALVNDFVGGGNLIILGAGVASTTIVANVNGDCFTIDGFFGAMLFFKGMTLQPDPTHVAILADSNGHDINVGDPALPVNFNLAPNTEAFVIGGQTQLITFGPITVNSTTNGGNIVKVIAISQQGLLDDIATWTITGNPNFTTAFITITDESHYDGASSGGFAGAATGKRYIGTLNSDFDVPSANLTFFPGNAAGTVDASTSYGGLYFATQKSGAPAATDLVAGSWGVFKDTNAGTVVIAYNDGGVIKTAALV